MGVSVIFLGRVVPVGSGRAALRWVRGDVLTFISRLTYVGNPLPRYAPFWLIASFFKGWFISPGCPTKMAIQRARSDPTTYSRTASWFKKGLRFRRELLTVEARVGIRRGQKLAWIS